MSDSRSSGSSASAAMAFAAAATVMVAAAALPMAAAEPVVGHLVISEIVTGAASASDELIEIYNPSAAALPLEGLEIVYVSASGATVGRRAAWDAGAQTIPPGGHLLVANEAGIYASIADAVYATGMAASGGSVALRIQGASSGIDAVGWGTAASTWLEGTPAPAPAAGSSLERLPGGSLGSTRDTDDNAADFAVREVPDPRNAGSPPVPDPTVTLPPTPAPTTEPTPPPTAAPSEGSPALAIATARALADGTTVVVEGTALTASDFHDGGGYVADETGGIAVIVADGGFAAGALLRISGTLDDRFAQRTLRTTATGLTVLGTGTEPAALERATGAVGEDVEGRLVRIAGTVDGSPTALSGGLAYDLDDGSGPTRVVVGSATGVETGAWTDGALVELVGVVGQRDSSGTGTSGYRVQPRSVADIVGLAHPTPNPTPSPSAAGSAAPSATPLPPGVVTIREARAAAKNTRVTVRGVVTLGSGVLEGTAVVQDGSGAIVLRLGDEAGSVARGESVEVSGTRSTKGGMETIRVTSAPRRLGEGQLPAERVIGTGAAAEEHEALLILVRGAVVAKPRTSTSGSISFEVDDGSGPLRVSVGGSLGTDPTALPAGSWIEVRGVLGQETTGAQPLRGYRVWPGAVEDIRIVAGATEASATTENGASGGSSGRSAVSLAGLGGSDLSGLVVGATLVAGPWEELDLGGLLWDGRRLVGIGRSDGAAVAAVSARAPVRLELHGLRPGGVHARTGLPLAAPGREPGDVTVGGGPPHPPLTDVPRRAGSPRWVTIVGRLSAVGPRLQLEVGGRTLAVERRCAREDRAPLGMASVTGIGLAEPSRIIVACDGIAAAPSLALTPPGARHRPVAMASSRTFGAATPTTHEVEPGHLLATALLATAAATLVAGAVARRRLTSAAPEALEEVNEEPVRDAGAPRLTLVRLPQEHGPG